MNPFSCSPEKNINTTVFHLSVHIWVLRGPAFQHAVWWHSAATPTPAHIPSCCVWGTVLPRVESRRWGSCVLGPMLGGGPISMTTTGTRRRLAMHQAVCTPPYKYPTHEAGMIAIPCYSRGEGRHEQGSHLAKVKTLGKWQSQSLDPGSFSPQSALFTSPLTNEHDPLKLWERGKDSSTEGVEAPVPSLDSFV